VVAVSKEASDRFAALARRIVDRLGAPRQIGDIEIEPGASLGMTVFPDDPGGLDDLIMHADHALYAAKQTGRGTWMLFADVEAGRTAPATVTISAASWSVARSTPSPSRVSAPAPLEMTGTDWARTRKE
jgi:predicted signal transduction protein with EAL and GGDEF domain